MNTRLLFLAAMCLATVGCAGTPSPSPSGQPTTVSIVLHAAPANLGCDSIAPPYRVVTFRIDASALEQVSAVTDTGARLTTFWAQGFRGGSSADPVVRDPSGSVIVADGDVLVIPGQDWPRLAGYFVCPSPDALYVLLADPS